MANGLRAGKVLALHGGAHATATTNRTAEERTPGPWDDGQDGQDGHKTNGRAQSPRTLSSTLILQGWPVATLQASCVMPGKLHAAAAAHLKGLTLRLPRCAQAAPSRGRGEEGENG